MPETKPHTPQRKPGEAWTEEEKSRGAAKPATEGEAGAGGRPNDDRAATESAAANIDPKPQP
jgi:hypothetical protein